MVVYNFSRLRLFCAGGGLKVLCVGKSIVPVLDHIGVEENYLFVVCWCYLVLTTRYVSRVVYLLLWL